MTLIEIKTAVDAGKRVCWANVGYEIVHDSCDQWLIWCRSNDNYIGLTHSDDVTMNGREDQFFIDDTVEADPVIHALEKAQRCLQQARRQILDGTRHGGGGVSRGLAMDIAVVQDEIAPVLNRVRNDKWRSK